jgi:DNA-binding transcriptional MocR family regulator
MRHCGGQKTVPRIDHFQCTIGDDPAFHRPRPRQENTRSPRRSTRPSAAIESGQIPSDAKLPSWRDLAAQLGVSRGTVRLAYERLIDEQLALGLGAAGTRVTERRSAGAASPWSAEAPPMPDLFHDFGTCRCRSRWASRPRTRSPARCGRAS